MKNYCFLFFLGIFSAIFIKTDRHDHSPCDQERAEQGDIQGRTICSPARHNRDSYLEKPGINAAEAAVAPVGDL